MLKKDRDEKASPFVILLDTLLGMASMVLDVVVLPSSYLSWNYPNQPPLNCI